MRLLAELHRPDLQINNIHVFRAINDSLNAVSLEFQSEVKVSITKKRLIDTGRLRASIMADINGLTARVGTDVKYAAIHEYGGVIKPKRKKVLAWLADDKKGSVVTYRVFTNQGGNFRRLKKPKKQTQKWIFAKQVRIREKRYFRDARDSFNPKMKRILENVVSDAVLRMRGETV
jgi:hypothetical protein